MTQIDLQGLFPANVTPFLEDDSVDFEALRNLGRWLADVEGVSGIVCNGHAGEGLSLTPEERADVVRALVEAVEGTVPVIAGIGGEGSRVAALEAKRAADAGASAALVYPTHIWLRMGYQPGAPEDRYRVIAEESGLPLVLFLYPDSTRATYDLETILRIGSMEAVVAVKHGLRNMARWDTELPVIRRELPGLRILTCHDEYLLHTAWEADGAILGYGSLIPELLAQLLYHARRRDYEAAMRIYQAITPLTEAVYHLEPPVSSTVALKVGLKHRGIIPTERVRSPLLPLGPAEVHDVEAAMKQALELDNLATAGDAAED